MMTPAALASALVTDTRSPSFLATDFEVVAMEGGACVVCFTDARDGEKVTSPTFPNKTLAAEWACDHLYLCGG